jgi:hypothetical protein
MVEVEVTCPLLFKVGGAPPGDCGSNPATLVKPGLGKFGDDALGLVEFGLTAD